MWKKCTAMLQCEQALIMRLEMVYCLSHFKKSLTLFLHHLCHFQINNYQQVSY